MRSSILLSFTRRRTYFVLVRVSAGNYILRRRALIDTLLDLDSIKDCGGTLYAFRAVTDSPSDMCDLSSKRDNLRNLQCRSSLDLPLTLRYLSDLAISLELAQDLQQAPLRRFMQVLRHVFVDDLDDLDRRPRGGGAIVV